MRDANDYGEKESPLVILASQISSHTANGSSNSSNTDNGDIVLLDVGEKERTEDKITDVERVGEEDDAGATAGGVVGGGWIQYGDIGGQEHKHSEGDQADPHNQHPVVKHL